MPRKVNNNNNNSLDLYSAFQGTQGRFTSNRAKTNITKQKSDKTTDRLGAESLCKQMGLEGPFEGVKCGDVANLRRESVPEGGEATLKALSPKVRSLVRGVVSRPESEDRRFRGGACG